MCLENGGYDNDCCAIVGTAVCKNNFELTWGEPCYVADTWTAIKYTCTPPNGGGNNNNNNNGGYDNGGNNNNNHNYNYGGNDCYGGNCGNNNGGNNNGGNNGGNNNDYYSGTSSNADCYQILMSEDRGETLYCEYNVNKEGSWYGPYSKTVYENRYTQEKTCSDLPKCVHFDATQSLMLPVSLMLTMFTIVCSLM